MNAPTKQQDRPRTLSSHILHRIDHLASRPLLAVVVVLADLLWVAGSIVTGFPTRVEAVFQSVVAALTLAIVFVIQHTQAREQIVTQRKLDEILRSLPNADNTLIAFEGASDQELRSARDTHEELRHRAVNSRADDASGGPVDA
ncbi:MAG: low affinity iron permease family protein [Actinomycetota bacterium]|nr:low affinity iron permease family protein [Actinomycetota bacterium]